MSRVENLTKRYGSFQLNVPLMDLPDQGIVALMGPSGCGKTSLIRLLLGIETPDRGTWFFQGENWLLRPIEKRQLGVVFQSYDLFPHMTSAENILFAAEARRLNKDEAQEQLISLSSALQLDRVLKTKAYALSGGEQQRVALARALISKPLFIFLDEPFSALDTDLKKDARELVKSVIEKHQIPTLLITHDPVDAEALAQKIIRLQAPST